MLGDMKLATGAALLCISLCFAAEAADRRVVARPVIVVQSGRVITLPYYGYGYGYVNVDILHAPIVPTPFVPTFNGPTTTIATDPPALRRKRRPITAEPKPDQAQ